MAFEDMTLTCRDCGKQFIFTAGEQEFYAQKGFLHEPVRCPECRRARKQAMGKRDRRGGGRNQTENQRTRQD
jgi:ssDNA-binding Zn-finger/Zn-ribbon topoisomerase 1